MRTCPPARLQAPLRTGPGGRCPVMSWLPVPAAGHGVRQQTPDGNRHGPRAIPCGGPERVLETWAKADPDAADRQRDNASAKSSRGANDPHRKRPTYPASSGSHCGPKPQARTAANAAVRLRAHVRGAGQAAAAYPPATYTVRTQGRDIPCLSGQEVSQYPALGDAQQPAVAQVPQDLKAPGIVLQ